MGYIGHVGKMSVSGYTQEVGIVSCWIYIKGGH